MTRPSIRKDLSRPPTDHVLLTQVVEEAVVRLAVDGKLDLKAAIDDVEGQLPATISRQDIIMVIGLAALGQ